MALNEPLWPDETADLAAYWPEKGPEFADFDERLGTLTIVPGNGYERFRYGSKKHQSLMESSATR